MEELNKTQLILLALLVSFVTSIATGIVTVALMDQAPPAVTQTINRVIKETERVIVPSKQQATVETVIVKEEDYIVGAIDANVPNIITIALLEKRKSRLGFTNADDTKRKVMPLGMGTALTKEGLVVFPGALASEGDDLAVVTRAGNYYAVTENKRDESSGLVFAEVGKSLTLAETSEDTSGEIIVDLAKETETRAPLRFIDAQFVDSKDIKLGQTAVTVGLFGSDPRILLGTVSGIGISKDAKIMMVYTTISAGTSWNGSPLLDSAGKIMGLTLIGAEGNYSAVSGDVAKSLLAAVIASKEENKIPAKEIGNIISN